MEQGLYAKMVMLHRKDLKTTEAKKNKKAKFKFHGKSARSQRWFDLDFDQVEGNFSTRETEFYRKIFQGHDKKQDTNIFKKFEVPVRNSKCVENIKFHTKAPIFKYCQKSLNGCCFSSLVS